MRTRTLQSALTLVDMILAVAIVAVLAGIVLTTLTRIDTKSREHLCQGTLQTLNTALRQFRDYGYQYRIDTPDDDEREFYRSLKFPPDCNDFTEVDVEIEITDLLDLFALADITPSGGHDPNNSGSACMYFFLSQVPQCRETLAAIDQSLLKSDHNNDGVYLTIDLDTINPISRRTYPWLRVVDPWGIPLKYDYYDETEVLLNTLLGFRHAKQTIRGFPLITSAGPDRLFDTDDDITNRERTEGATYQP